MYCSAFQFELTSRALSEIESYISRTPEDVTTPVLMKGKIDGGQDEWMIRGYTDEQVRNLESLVKDSGRQVNVSIGALNLVFPQPQLVEEVRGKTLDFQASRWIVE